MLVKTDHIEYIRGDAITKYCADSIYLYTKLTNKVYKLHFTIILLSYISGLSQLLVELISWKRLVEKLSGIPDSYGDKTLSFLVALF